MPMASPSRLAWLSAQPYAHRGLHGPDSPENSLAAARSAIAGGYGIECDVRLSRDGVPHVFHDHDLARLTGQTGRLADLDASAIARLKLIGGNEPPPTLTALLALCTHTPLLIEIKLDGDAAALARLCAAVARLLATHGGPVAVMSFDPRACRWFARHAPRVTRGLVLSSRYRTPRRAWSTNALAKLWARPHFLACDVRDLPNAASSRRLPLLCWTVRTQRQRALAHACRTQIIFEG
jgi:glycerophosphoryl diester phosphodiesterase